jgi:hypothetical protein
MPGPLHGDLLGVGPSVGGSKSLDWKPASKTRLRTVAPAPSLIAPQPMPSDRLSSIALPEGSGATPASHKVV